MKPNDTDTQVAYGLAMMPFPNGEQERPELGSELLAQVSETVSVLKKARTGLAGLEPYIATLQNAKALADRKVSACVCYSCPDYCVSCSVWGRWIW